MRVSRSLTTFQVFDHLERFAVLGLKFGDTLRQLGLGAYAVLRQKRHRLCHLLEIEHLGPAFVACALARGQLDLDVDQVTYFIRIRVSTAESGGFLVFSILGENSQNIFLGKIIAQLAGGNGLGPAGGAVTETAAALSESDAMLLQKLSGEVLEIGRLSQNGTDIFAQDGFLGFVFGLPDGQAGSCVLGVGVVEAALAAPLRPILPFSDAVAGTFQQVDLVEAGILAKLHDLGTEMPEHSRRTAVLAAFLPVAGLLHVGLACDFTNS